MRSEYLSVRMPPETKAAMERIRDEYNSKAGPGPRKTWTTAELLTSAIMEAAERWGAQLDAEKAAEVKVKAPKPKASKAAPKASPKAKAPKVKRGPKVPQSATEAPATEVAQ